MRNGACPKCESRNIYKGTHVTFKSGGSGSNSIPITAFTTAALDNYVCIDCGFLESYISNKSKLEKIASKWPLSVR